MKSIQHKKTNIRNKPHSQESASAITHKSKARRKFASALKRFTLKSRNSSDITKSESDFSEKNNSPRIDYSQFYFKKLLEAEQGSCINLSSLPGWTEPILSHSQPVKAKTSSLINEYSMERSEDSYKNSGSSTFNNSPDNLFINQTDLPSVSRSDINVENNAQKSFENKEESRSFPTSSSPEISSTLNLPLSIALKEVLDLTSYLQDSEINIRHVLSKYIRNENLKEELLKALSEHNKLQIENERRSFKLANELFSKELELSREREKTLQDSLDVAAYFNRVLEEEVENLKAKNEKFLFNYHNNRDCFDDLCIKNTEDLYKNNSELRIKYKNLLRELKKLDNELKTLQNQNKCFVNQLGNANGQIRNYRDMLHRAMGEHELEHVALSHQISINEQLIKNCVEAGDVLLNDLMMIQKELKPLSLDINLSKFKNQGDTLVDLLHLSRNCLKEITTELLNIHNKTNIRQKESTNTNYKTNSNDVDEHKSAFNLRSYESKIQLQTQKIQIMKSEIDLAKNEAEIVAESLRNEKIKTSSHEKLIQELKNQIANRDMKISNLNTNIIECRNEITGLKFQINAMQKFLDDNQLSNVVQELLDAQQKCSYYEKQFYQLELDKSNLTDQSKIIDCEKDSLIKFQQSFFEHLQQQQKDIEDLNRQNNELKKQLTKERDKLIDKSAELAKQIEVTNLMQTVQSQFNLEYSKNLSLEANALNTNYEMNRLSVVAEYNNEISKQLKSIITAKDKTISKLKANLDKLNENEKSNLEQKAALCIEITEASCLIKQLKTELENEKRDKKKIENEKDSLEKNADNKIQELHKMIIDERQALRTLLKEHQEVLNQKNNIEALQKEQLIQIEIFVQNEDKMKSSIKDVNVKCSDLEMKCDNLTKKLEEVYEIIDTKETKVRNTTIEYENKLSVRDGIVEKQKCKNEELQNTIKFLQCNIKKMQSDLNELRSNDKTKTDQIKQCSSVIEEFQINVEQHKLSLDKCYSEKQQLEQRLIDAIDEYNSLYDEYNQLFNQFHQMEDQYKQEIQTLNTSKTKSIEDLTKASKENLIQIENKQKEINGIKDEMKNLDKVRNEFYEKTRILEDALNKQHKFDDNIIKEKDRCIQKVRDLSKAVVDLKSELHNCIKQRDDDIISFKKFTESFKIDTEAHKKSMVNDLNQLSTELTELSERFTDKSTKLHDLRIQYKELTENMKKVLNLLVKEKFEHKTVETENILLKKEIDDLKSNNNNSITEVNTKEIIFLENIGHKTDLENAKKYLDEATNNIEYLETKVHITEEKLRKLEQITIMQESYMVSQLKNRSDLLGSVNKEHAILLERYNKLKQHSKMTNQVMIALKAEIAHLNQTIQILEFQKCDLTLRYHELNGKFQNEQSLNTTLKQTHQRLLTAAYDMSSVSSIQSITNLD